MCDRSCANCLYACGVRNGPAGMLVCANCPEAPGDLTQVQPDGVCPLFRAKPKPVLRPEVLQPPDPFTKVIPLTRGKVALVDPADYEWLKEYKWHAMKVGQNYYACRKEGGKSILMHREIMKAPAGKVVDHKNHQTLDNHQGNLRECTQQQNVWNSRPHNPKSGFKNVTPHRDKWAAKFKYKGKTYRLWDYDDPVEAARARDRKAHELCSEYAWFNLPGEVPGRVLDLSGTAHGQSGASASLQVRRRGSSVWE
jgi:hypothetical protein